MKAMIMAAGVGSRLDPVTQSVPKPLVRIANRPVMDILLENLAKIGVDKVIANTYYLADKIIERYSSNPYGINFNYIKEETLSGTAGGLKKCQSFFDNGEDFMVLSADGLFDTDLRHGIDIHKKSGAIATIGIKQIPQEEVSLFGVAVIDKNGYITEFQEKPAVKDAKSNFINTGIYIFNSKIFDFIPANTFYDFAKNVFPKLLELNQINTFEIKDYWSDIGTLEQYKQSNFDVFEGLCNFPHSEIIPYENGKLITDTKNVDIDIHGNCTIGKNCKFGKNVRIENSILWDNVEIYDNAAVKDCIILSNCIIKSNLTSQIYAENSCIEDLNNKCVTVL